MIPVIPWWATAATLAATAIVPVVLWLILDRGAERSGLPSGARRRVRLGSALFLGGWAGLALLLSPAPATLAQRDPFYLSPLLPGFALGGIVFTLALIRWLPALRQAVAGTSLPALVGVQLWRVLGLMFVILMTLGQLPARFAQPAGWGDVVIGLTAPLLALALARGLAGSRAIAAAWNVVGLLDLVVAVGMGTGFLPILFGGRVPPAAAMGAFPLILVPTFAVPLAVVLHLVALGRLRHTLAVSPALTPRVARA